MSDRPKNRIWVDGSRAGSRQSRRGATLVEIALCVAIIGIGIAALMEFFASGTRANAATIQTSLGIQYARAGWETVMNQGFDAVRTWTSATPTQAPALTSLPDGLERRIWVENLDIDNLTGPAASGAISDKLRVNVGIFRGTSLVYQQVWILTKPS